MPTNLEIAASKLLHPSNSKNFFPNGRGSIENPYVFPIVEFLHEELDPAYEIITPGSGKTEYADDDLTSDHTRIEKQVSENPGTTGETAPKVSKLPSQSVNSATLSGSAESRERGILSIGFIRRIASKFSAKWGNKGKS